MKLPLSIAFLILGAISSIHAEDKTIHFSGYDWEIRPTAEKSGPGPNYWDEKNVWVDAAGKLHLKLTKQDGKWHCAEIYTKKSYGFGAYQFWITGRIDKLDRNLVFGLFNYPEPGVGVDGEDEIDIEYAKWRRTDAKANICNYTAYPSKKGPDSAAKNFPVTLHDDALSTQRFTWTPQRIFFQSLPGHTDGSAGALAEWNYQPSEAGKHIAQKPMPVHINLWCCDGYAPADGREVEVVVDAFKFTPQP